MYAVGLPAIFFFFCGSTCCCLLTDFSLATLCPSSLRMHALLGDLRRDLALRAPPRGPRKAKVTHAEKVSEDTTFPQREA